MSLLSYALWMAGSALLSILLFSILLKKEEKRLPLCILSLLLGSLLGAVCAKLVFYITQIGYMMEAGLWESLWIFDDPSQFSYYGGVIGVCLGVACVAKITGAPILKSLDAFAPAGALMAALARFGEGFLGMLGTGMYMENENTHFFPLAVSNEWEEWYLAVFMLEGLAYLFVFLAALSRFRSHAFLRTVFFLCLPQILLESLRNQGMFWLFVRVEQLICMVGLEAVLFLYGLLGKGKKLRFRPALLGLAMAAVFVGAEFALDKTDISRLITYAVMALGLVFLGFVECRAFRRLVSDVPAKDA